MRAVSFAAIAALMVASCAPTAPSEPATPKAGNPERCDAGAAQSLIGSHIGAVSFAPDTNVRIVCTTCPTTRDLRPDRLNVRFEQATGIIKAVDCG